MRVGRQIKDMMLGESPPKVDRLDDTLRNHTTNSDIPMMNINDKPYFLEPFEETKTKQTDGDEQRGRQGTLGKLFYE